MKQKLSEIKPDMSGDPVFKEAAKEYTALTRKVRAINRDEPFHKFYIWLLSLTYFTYALGMFLNIREAVMPYWVLGILLFTGLFIVIFVGALRHRFNEKRLITLHVMRSRIEERARQEKKEYVVTKVKCENGLMDEGTCGYETDYGQKDGNCPKCLAGKLREIEKPRPIGGGEG